MNIEKKCLICGREKDDSFEETSIEFIFAGWLRIDEIEYREFMSSIKGGDDEY